MKLVDLKNGMSVQLRNGERYVFIETEGSCQNIFMNFDNTIGVSHWNDDLTHRSNKSYDIVKVFRKARAMETSRSVIWERCPFEKWDIVKHNEKDITVVVTSNDSQGAYGFRISNDEEKFGSVYLVSSKNFHLVGKLVLPKGTLFHLNEFLTGSLFEDKKSSFEPENQFI